MEFKAIESGPAYMFSLFRAFALLNGGGKHTWFTFFGFSQYAHNYSMTGQPAKMHKGNHKAATMRYSSPPA